MLAGNEYLKRHKKALKLLMATLTVEKIFLATGQYGYKPKWERGTVIENDKVKLCWNFKR